MNISILTYSVTRDAGGVYDAVRELFTNDAFRNQQLKLFSFTPSRYTEDINTWGHIDLRIFDAGPFLYSTQMKRAVMDIPADVLHMETLWRWPQFIMSDWRERRRQPIVCSPHGMLDPYIIESQGWAKRLFARVFMQCSLESVTCYHALCIKELEDIRAYGLKQPVAVIPNGINLPSPDLHFEKKDSKKHLLYLGRLHKKKGVDLLLLALGKLSIDNPDLLVGWQIDIVGWDDENSLAGLKTIVAQYKLVDIVKFHGALFGTAKAEMYAKADAYILPSHGEGLPMTVLEAWSWRVPVLMTPKCNIPEGYNAGAAICIYDSEEAVAKGLTQLFTMPDVERKQMGENGYKLVSEQFTWDVSARKMIQMYEWLLNKTSKPDFVYE